MNRASRLARGLRVLRTEGLPGTVARLADLLGEQQRKAGFRRLSHPRQKVPRSPILNLLPTPPRSRLGGVQTQYLARARHETRNRALLYPTTGGWRLEISGGDGGWFQLFDGPRPDPLALHLGGFREIVECAMQRVGAELLHVESATGLPLEDLASLAGEHPVLLGCQDFGLFCPRPHLLEQPGDRFCHYSIDDLRCASCLSITWSIDSTHLQLHRAASRRLLDTCSAVTHPSEFLRQRIFELFEGAGADRHRILPPARPKSATFVQALPRRHTFAFLGGGAVHKGAVVFTHVVEALARVGVESRWRVYGGGEPGRLRAMAGLPGVTVRGYYRASQLGRLLVADGVSAALFLSIVPESYGLAVDESLHAGVPVLAFDLGAPSERIRSIPRAGWLVPPDAGSGGVARQLQQILAEAPPEGPDAGLSLPSDPANVVRLQEALYRELLPPAATFSDRQ